MPHFDVITMGRVSVDLYPEQIGVPLAEVRTFVKSVGGSPTNVAVAAARFGHPAAVITRVGDDAFGLSVRAGLGRFGVDTRWVGTVPGLRTPLAIPEVYPPDRFPILFYRAPKAPDMEIRVDDLDLDAIRDTAIFWTTGTGLSDEPSRTATLSAMESRGPRPTVFDLDYRPSLWPAQDARAWAIEGVKRATVVVGNLEEASMAVDTADPGAAATRLLELGPELVVIKLGASGSRAQTRTQAVEAPGVPVRVVCGLGAGDAFGGALCHGLLSGWSLERTLRFGNAAGAIVASQLLCSDAMPTVAEVEAVTARAIHA
jgi:5-dehydro-2-deoxygluconokinase